MKIKKNISSVRSSVFEYSKLTYKYIDGHVKLVQESSEKFDTEQQKIHITIKELQGNEMVIVEEYDKPLISSNP